MRINLSEKRNIYLMGFMGCGKSKVGKIIAQKLGWPFLDTDTCIVKDAGLTIPEIFEQMGESHFRELEKKMHRKNYTPERPCHFPWRRSDPRSGKLGEHL
jgi:shikimate kinase